MYHPTTRLLTILEILQTRPFIQGWELATQLEVDSRTVRRYIQMLQDMGIPINGTRGRYGGYQLLPGYKLPPLMFSEDEGLALTIGLLVAEQIGVGLDNTAVARTRHKIERVMPAALRERFLTLQSVLEITLPLPQHRFNHDLVLTISHAVQQHRTLFVRYQSWQGDFTERHFDPYGLLFRSGYWYTAGYCHLRDGIRVFRLDRVGQAHLTSQTFERPAAFDTLVAVEQGIARTPTGWEVHIELHTSLEEAQRLVPAAMATLTDQGDTVLLQCHMKYLPWFALWLLELDCPLTIQQPAELRMILRELSERARRLSEE